MAEISRRGITRAIFEVLVEAGCMVLHEHLHRRVEAKFNNARWPDLKIDPVLHPLVDSGRIIARGMTKDVGWGQTITENAYEIGNPLDGLSVL